MGQFAGAQSLSPSTDDLARLTIVGGYKGANSAANPFGTVRFSTIGMPEANVRIFVLGLTNISTQSFSVLDPTWDFGINHYVLTNSTWKRVNLPNIGFSTGGIQLLPGEGVEFHREAPVGAIVCFGTEVTTFEFSNPLANRIPSRFLKKLPQTILKKLERTIVMRDEEALSPAIEITETGYRLLAQDKIPDLPQRPHIFQE